MIFDVSILSETAVFKTSNGKGYKMMRDIDLFSPEGDPANWDVIVVPGGIGSRIEMRNEKLLKWIRSFAHSNVDTPGGKRKVIMGVCTGSLILATAGILDGMKLTTHHNARVVVKDLVEEHGGEAEVVEDKVVEQILKEKGGTDLGIDVITSGGVSSGIDAALYLVKKLVGSECANGTAAWIEYDWKDIY